MCPRWSPGRINVPAFIPDTPTPPLMDQEQEPPAEEVRRMEGTPVRQLSTIREQQERVLETSGLMNENVNTGLDDLALDTADSRFDTLPSEL